MITEGDYKTKRQGKECVKEHIEHFGNLVVRNYKPHQLRWWHFALPNHTPITWYVPGSWRYLLSVGLFFRKD